MEFQINIVILDIKREATTHLLENENKMNFIVHKS
jgi:hypothetical protein